MSGKSDTPMTDAAVEADSHLYQILYSEGPMCERPVRMSRMQSLEREITRLREALENVECNLQEWEEAYANDCC